MRRRGRGRVGAIIIHTTLRPAIRGRSSGLMDGQEQFELPDDGRPRVRSRRGRPRTLDDDRARSRRGPRRAARARPQTRDFRPVPLGVTARPARSQQRVRTWRQRQRHRAAAGRDPKLARRPSSTRRTTITSGSAGERPGSDAIYNGALDNASGVAAMLAVAKAFDGAATGRPAADLFASRDGGGAGTARLRVLREASAVPPGRIAANINIDGVEHLGPHEGHHVGRARQVVARPSDRRAREDAGPGRQARPVPGPRPLLPLRPVQPREGSACPPRTSTAAPTSSESPTGWGKPRIEEWEEKDYHQPSDELTSDWDLSGAVEDMRLLFRLGVKVADAPLRRSGTPATSSRLPARRRSRQSAPGKADPRA